MKHSAFATAVSVLLVALSGAELWAQEETPSAETLLQQMAKTYSAAQSYADKSVAIYRNKDGSERLQVEFRVWFVRPASFRVDAQSKPPLGGSTRREVLWTEGSGVRTWASDKPVVSRARVQLAGSGMFGTYAYHVPTLLEASYGMKRRLPDLAAPTVLGEAAFEGVDCYRVRGDWQGDTYEVWLGKSDHLVHKIAAEYRDHQLEEVHREIVVDQPVGKNVFRFAPENEVPAPKPKK